MCGRVDGLTSSLRVALWTENPRLSVKHFLIFLKADEAATRMNY